MEENKIIEIGDTVKIPSGSKARVCRIFNDQDYINCDTRDKGVLYRICGLEGHAEVLIYGRHNKDYFLLSDLILVKKWYDKKEKN